MTEDRGRTFPEAAHLADTARSYLPRLRGRAGVGLCARSLLLRSDLAQAVDDAALRRHRVFREVQP